MRKGWLLMCVVCAAVLLAACNVPASPAAAEAAGLPTAAANPLGAEDPGLCAAPPTAAPAVCPTLAPAQPFEGVWIAASGETLVLTADRYYYRFMQDGRVYEHDASIQAVDAEQQTLQILLQSIRIDGQGYGFDSPGKTVKYQIEGDTLRFGVSDVEVPAVSELVFERKGVGVK